MDYNHSKFIIKGAYQAYDSIVNNPVETNDHMGFCSPVRIEAGLYTKTMA